MIDVYEVPDRRRYEVTVDGARVGLVEYVIKGGRYLLVHTEVDDAFEGQGVGSALVRGVLDDLRERGKTVLPLCPFVASYVERHPDYDDMVDHKAMAMLEGR